ncbi:MAG: hypothetical protein KDC01_06055 [Flavobacteriales bacterium]|jgi:hypothetical protein|nr:hypothetical protein [Flavobacteriales bacterium]
MPELNDDELRKLFQKAGHEQAPDALHPAIMEQVMGTGTAPAVKPLIAPRQWLWVGLVLAAVTALVWILSSIAPGEAAKRFTSPVHLDLSALAQALQYSTWIAMAMVLAFALTLVDRMLSGAHHRASH